jgi:diacylglycerol kinase family enzyme
MRVTLVLNPTAGDQAHSSKQLLQRLAEAGYDAELVDSGRKGIKKMLEDPGQLVVVAGGDGTIRKVAIALVDRRVPMAILPIGTANNIAKSLGISGSVQDLIARWHYDRRRKLALGTVSAPFGTTRFVESAGVGVFTELVVRGREEVGENIAGLTGHEIDRALLLLQRIVAEREPLPRRLEIDGADFSGEYLLVEVMNTPLLGPNVPLAPDADFGDDRLDVVTVTNAERRVLTEYLERRLHGGAAPPQLTVRRGRRITMRTSPRELHLDDAPWESNGPKGQDQMPREQQAEATMAIGAAGVEVLAAG